MRNLLFISLISVFLISCSGRDVDLVIVGEPVGSSSTFLAQDIANGGTWCLSSDIDIYLAGDIFELDPHTIVDDYYANGQFTRNIVSKRTLQISEAFDGIWGASEFELYTETEEEELIYAATVDGDSLILETEFDLNVFYTCTF